MLRLLFLPLFSRPNLRGMWSCCLLQVTWRREDNNEIIMKDSLGTKQLSSSNHAF